MGIDLPFIEQNEDRISNFWSVSSSGRYTTDCQKGRAYGTDVINYMRQSNAPIILPHIIKAMNSSEGGKWTGIEIGFVTALAEAAMKAS